MAAKKQIFRQSALDRLSSPEQLDQLMRITQPRSWVALLGLMALLLFTVVWSITGTVPVEISAPVIFTKTGGFQQIEAVESGWLSRLEIAVGDTIEAGNLIGEIQRQIVDYDLNSLLSGRVVSVQATVGDVVEAGEIIATIEQDGILAQQEAVLFLSPAAAAQIKTDMRVHLSAMGNTPSLIGQVVEVGSAPLTTGQALRFSGSQMALDNVAFEPGHVQVRVQIVSDADLTSGTFGTARVVLDEIRPIDFVLPINE